MIDQPTLDAAIATVAAMTEDEFYTACEALGITYCTNQRQEHQ